MNQITIYKKGQKRQIHPKQHLKQQKKKREKFKIAPLRGKKKKKDKSYLNRRETSFDCVKKKKKMGEEKGPKKFANARNRRGGGALFKGERYENERAGLIPLV